MTTTLTLIGIIGGWGILALLLLMLTLARARRLLLRPIPREEAPATPCRSCRLPFYTASWRCGRCGAFRRPVTLYVLARYLIQPLIRLIVLPWIIAVGMLLSLTIGLVRFLLPPFSGPPEKFAARLGNWIAPLFRRWVPHRWRIYSTAPRLEPAEIDAPVDTVIEAALILATALLESGNGEIGVLAFDPSEETLEILRREKGGVHEVWGYVSDRQVLVPSYSDEIIGALMHGDDLAGYVDGLTHHLSEPSQEIEIEPSERTEREGRETVPWSFRIRRVREIKGEYPLHWEVLTDHQTLPRIESLIEDLTTWESLPCALVIR